jgi:penicillin-binding protein 1A
VEAPKRVAARHRPRIVTVIFLLVLFTTVAAIGLTAGALFGFTDDLPAIVALDDYRPSATTRVLAVNGEVIGDFATERRFVVGYDEIAPALRNAVVAVEDASFNEHLGLSMSRIVVTAVRDILTGRRAGASTLTQQLSRDLYLRDYRRNGIFERSLERKIREAIVAVQLEKRFTKRELFTLYANQIYFGHGAYGVEAASRLYFLKSAADLALEEAATLAAIIQAPGRLSPFVNRERTRTRRNYVLQRMVKEGLVSPAEAERASALPVRTVGRPRPDRSAAPYLVEEVRKLLERQYGAAAIYEGGLTVQSTIDAGLQAAVNASLDRGLRTIDKRRATYKKPSRNVVASGEQPDRVTFNRWTRPIRVGDIVPAIVMDLAVGQERGAGILVRIGATNLVMLRAGYSWTRRTAADLFSIGDIIEVRVKKLAESKPSSIELEQSPDVEGAVIAIDNQTGEIRAMAGGFSFQRSQFNRATQARRQMGSVFKPVVYAAALDHGMTPVTELVDEPVAYEVGANQPLYEPRNYDHKFEGPITLRRALEKSRNIPAVKALVEVGPATVLNYANRFGFAFARDTQPYLSLALGATEATLLEVTSAYSTFPNHGLRMTPYFLRRVSDRDGNLLEQHHTSPQDTLSAATAFLVTNLLQGVVQHGTAAAAASLEWPLGGKTGTVDNYTDAWFVGFDPSITVGVWIGHDKKKPVGPDETGAAAALPIWRDVMRFVIDHRRDRDAPPTFDIPPGVEFARLPTGHTEAFLTGTVPEDLLLVPLPLNP